MNQFRCRPMMYGPSIATPSPLTSGVQGVPYSLTLTGTGGQPPYTYALVSGTLDTGITLSPGGVISGTPVNAEADVIGLVITDANGLKGVKQLFVLTFVPSLFLAGETLPLATLGVPYSQDISGQASGGTPPYVFSLLSSTGTDVWFVTTAGVINGIPGQASLVTDAGVPLVTDAGVQLTT